MPKPPPMLFAPPARLPATSAALVGLPLSGLTVLVVDDSRYACDALRLMCIRAGARLRRAGSLAAARAHLRTYRPDVVIVDLGLPDGRGEALIRELLLARPRPARVLGTSGAETGRAQALAAGADGFLDKPVESLSRFCALLCGHLPEAPPVIPASEATIRPDPLALHDDLAQAARLLDAAPGHLARGYVTQFLQGLARHSRDPGLANAARRAECPGDPRALPALRALVECRLANSDQGFPGPAGHR